LVTGFFFGSSGKRHTKIVNFIKKQALAGHQFEIFTQNDSIPGEFSNGDDAEDYRKNRRFRLNSGREKI